jgi:uncharacterized membrane protein
MSVPQTDLTPIKVSPASAGWTWIVQGWALFIKAPVMWIVSIVILFIVAVALGMIPFIGQIAFQVLGPVFAAGFMVACRCLDTGNEFELEHLFAGFRSHFGSLVIVGLVALLGWVLIFLVFAAFVGFSLLPAILTGDAETMMTAGAAAVVPMLLGGLVALALSVPLVAAYWFAPALVALQGMPPLAAMKASFHGCFRNFVPFLVYGLIMMFFAILAAIPLGLGLLVWIPVMIASTYAAYRDIYTG